MNEVVLDVETKKAFSKVEKYDPTKLGVSYVGICRRLVENGAVIENKLEGFFEDELAKLWPIIEQADRIIGFNIVGFDFPAMSRYYHGDLSSLPVLDILDAVKQAVGYRVSLDAIAKETIGIGKSGSGLDALKYYAEGRLEELAKYCLDDVRITRDIYLHGLEHGEVSFNNKWNRLVTAKVDFSFKKNDDGSDVQMSLGV